ncbi:MAG: glucosyl-3-phosphoglycerate synthase [Actinomycetota bacterium]
MNEAASMPRTARVAREAVDAGTVSSATVLDGGSTDATASIARDAGIEVLAVSAVMPHLGPVLGKGDSLFRGVHSVEADWYVFLDADLGNIGLRHIAALTDRAARGDVVLVKGGFVRIDEEGRRRQIPGGRVTEEVARPLLAMAAPVLTGFSQPLSGQVAIRADVARALEFATGYGVEIAMLLDVWRRHGATALAEADMGEIQNRWKPDGALDEVRDQVLAAASLRGLGEAGRVHPMVRNRTP